MGRPDKQSNKKSNQGSQGRDSDDDADSATDGDTESQAAGSEQGGDSPEVDGYKPTRRQQLRDGDKPGKGQEAAKKGPPPTKFKQFMDDHWESWLSQVILIVVLGVGVVGYKLDYLREGMIGIVLAGGLVAAAIYGTAGPAYDLIDSKNGRTLFAILVVVWAAAVGYPTIRKAVPRKVLAETALTEPTKSQKVAINEGASGPYDVTISGSLRPEAGSERKVDYTVVVTGDNSQNAEVSGTFEVRVNQMRTRRGSTSWTQQHNQLEHRLPSSVRGHELTIATEQVDEMLQSGLHVAVHPQSLNPTWFLIIGILVVLAMLFVETRIGDAKNKPHLIMASATTLIFAWHFSENATANRLVAPALDSLFLSLITGGIGGTLVGAVVRRVSGRDRLKPKTSEELAEEKAKE